MMRSWLLLKVHSSDGSMCLFNFDTIIDFWQQISRYSISIFTETALINTRAYRGIRPLRFSGINFERVKIFDALSQFLKIMIGM
jgi:hypothetical protein